MQKDCTRLLAVGLFAGLVTAFAHAEPQAIAPISIAEYSHPHQQVEIAPGRHLDLFCIGHGAPTVILDTGFGSQMSDWKFVQGPISKLTKTCAYSRAGYLFSDPSTRKTDARNAVDDLHRLVQKAPIAAPFVLVGHSIGGLYATLYAATYPHDVAGMVLIDPAFAGESKAMMAGLSPSDIAKVHASSDKMRAFFVDCLNQAQNGNLAKPENAKSSCLDNPPDQDPGMHKVLTEYYLRPLTVSSIISEAQSATPSMTNGLSLNDRELEAAHVNFGAMPLVVLTAGNQQTSPDMTPAMIHAAADGWKAGHDKLAAYSSIGVNIVVPQSQHFIQKDQPGTVVKHVLQVVEAARQARH